MIKEIITLLKECPEETENIKIAKGKYKLPETIMEGWKVFKRELKEKINSVGR